MSDPRLVPAGGVNRVPPFDERTGEHYWSFPMLFHVSDPAAFFDQPDGPALFDAENLVMTATVGCFYCEQTYNRRIAVRRCKGAPGSPSWATSKEA